MMELIDAMSVRLDEVFDGKYPVYLEEVEQGLQTPCFFIQPIDGSDMNMISNRRYRTFGFVIVFIPDDVDGHRAQFAEVTDKLFDTFDLFELGDGVVLPTFNREVNVVDDVLQFIVRFKYYAYSDKEVGPLMDSLDMKVVK